MEALSETDRSLLAGLLWAVHLSHGRDKFNGLAALRGDVSTHLSRSGMTMSTKVYTKESKVTCEQRLRQAWGKP